MEDLFAGFNASQTTRKRGVCGATRRRSPNRNRTRRYRADDWKALAAEQAAIYDDVHAALKAGTSASDAAVMDIAERHRLSDRPLVLPVQSRDASRARVGSDERFRKSIDKHGEGLTPFLAEDPRQRRAASD